MQTFLECMGRHVFKIIVVGKIKQKTTLFRLEKNYCDWVQ